MINTLLHSVDEAMFNGMFVTDRLGQTLPELLSSLSLASYLR
jgi:hypothetical protein